MNKFTLPLFAALVLTVLTLSTTSCCVKKLGSEPPASAGPANKGFNAPQTFVNAKHKFKYTIPAGWFVINDDPTANEVSFMKSDHSMGFLISINANSRTENFQKARPELRKIKDKGYELPFCGPKYVTSTIECQPDRTYSMLYVLSG